MTKRISRKIPETSFTNVEERELIRLLKKVRDDDYRWPTEAVMRAAHNVISFWAPELVITRYGRKTPSSEILLLRYDGGVKEFQNMWHIPGGYNHWDESLIETCRRVSSREIGVDVRVDRVLDAYKWGEDHPYGHPLSLYVRCVPVAPVEERENLRFFSTTSLPFDTVEPHRRFIINCFA